MEFSKKILLFFFPICWKFVFSFVLSKIETRGICTSSCDDKTATATVIGIAVNLLPFFVFKYMMLQGGSFLTSPMVEIETMLGKLVCSERTWHRPLIIRREKLVEVILTCGVAASSAPTRKRRETLCRRWRLINRLMSL